MLVDSMEIKVNKNDAIKHIIRKTPLISKIDQFNRKIEDIHLEFVEYKVLKYEIISKRKNKNNFRSEEFKDNIIMIVNTYNGHSQSVDKTPKTIKRYIARSCIKKSNIENNYIIEKVKNEIINYFDSHNYDIICLNDVPLFKDGLHMNYEGHEMMSEEVLKKIINYR